MKFSLVQMAFLPVWDEWTLIFPTFVMEDNDPFIQYSQYYGCWLAGDTRTEGINSHDTDLVLPENSSFNTSKVNFSIAQTFQIQYTKHLIKPNILSCVKVDRA